VTNASLALLYSSQTDIGYVREKNEDALKTIPEHRFFALADGMGGLPGGEIASKRCMEYLSELICQIDLEIKSKEASENEVVALLGAAVERVNSALFKENQQENNSRGMGTTLCCVYFFKNMAILAHVGDSRIYRFRGSERKAPKFIQLTEDHSLVNELILQGELTRQDALFSPYKNILTKAIGIHPHVDPAISSLPVLPRDLFLLCSDGLTNYAGEEEIEEVLSKISLNSNSSYEKSLQEGVNQLISLAKSHGGGDNITAILVLSNPSPR